MPRDIQTHTPFLGDHPVSLLFYVIWPLHWVVCIVSTYIKKALMYYIVIFIYARVCMHYVDSCMYCIPNASIRNMFNTTRSLMPLTFGPYFCWSHRHVCSEHATSYIGKAMSAVANPQNSLWQLQPWKSLETNSFTRNVEMFVVRKKTRCFCFGSCRSLGSSCKSYCKSS